MLRFLLFILKVFNVLTWGILAQPAGFISIQKTGIPELTLASSNYYDGKSLWGYMNGGADLYMEYGFEGLLVQEIQYKGIDIKCEIYRMADPLSAFGIFSVQRHNCKTLPDIKANHCVNRYQVQMVKGDYYLSIINAAGTPSEQAVSVEIAEKLSTVIHDMDISFPEHSFFRNHLQKLIFLKGEISLGNVYPQGLAYLDEVKGYTMWLLTPDDKKMPAVSLIRFESTEGLDKYTRAAFPETGLIEVATRKLKKGGTLIARKIDENTILQSEGNTSKEIKKILGFDRIK